MSGYHHLDTRAQPRRMLDDKAASGFRRIVDITL